MSRKSVIYTSAKYKVRDQKGKLRKNAPEWPDLRLFFFIEGKFLWREQMNTLMGLNEKGEQIDNEDQLSNSQFELFLRGDRGISKKVFSFHQQSRRIWGYVKNEKMLNEVKKEVSELVGINEKWVKTGENVLKE